MANGSRYAWGAVCLLTEFGHTCTAGAQRTLCRPASLHLLLGQDWQYLLPLPCLRQYSLYSRCPFKLQTVLTCSLTSLIR